MYQGSCLFIARHSGSAGDKSSAQGPGGRQGPSVSDDLPPGVPRAMNKQLPVYRGG